MKIYLQSVRKFIFNRSCFYISNIHFKYSNFIKPIIMSKVYSLLTVLLVSVFCIFTAQAQASNVAQHQQQQQSYERAQQSPQAQIDQKRLHQMNFVINTYFKDCRMDGQSQVLYDCSIETEKYAEFLYGLFHKQLLMRFLQYYQLQGKIQKQTLIEEMYKVGEQVHQKVVAAYNDWIEVYKPNAEITVEKMYGDLVELDQDVLDIIEHNLQKHGDFVNVLKKIYKISNLSKKYIVMGKKQEEEVAEDMNGIYGIYFGYCRPISNCSIPINSFVYFLKQLSFYITPLTEQLQNRTQIVISQEMDFQATQFLIKQVNKIKDVLGDRVEYEYIKDYSYDLAQQLFYHLKGEQRQERAHGQGLQKQEVQNSKNRNASFQQATQL